MISSFKIIIIVIPSGFMQEFPSSTLPVPEAGDGGSC